ncbi:hypothetical protein [Natronorubrum sp. DTA7]|uniref:hypothetical protein n=1 Tax=Natronorubrum sp. DTA7 TaxID=3447016 RepID=UPI003F86758C
MRDNQQFQQSRHEPTEQLQQSTMNQGQAAIEQAIDLQRNIARMTLSAMQWQDTAQRQGVEITKSMMQGFPGQRFTQSMMESYLQGLEAVMPEMERAMEKGMQAATQAQPGPGQQMGSQHQSGQRMGQSDQQFGSQQRMGGQHQSGQQFGGQMGDQRSTGRTSGQQPGGQQPPDQQMGGQQQPHQQMADQPQSSQRMGQHTHQQERQYPQTGEWVSQAGTYGGEASGPADQQRAQQMGPGSQSGQQSQSHAGRQSQSRPDESHSQPTGAGSQQGSFGHETQQRSQPQQRGGDRPARGREQEHRRQDREVGQSTPRGQSSQPRNERGQYSQRIDTDRRGSQQDRQRQPIAQGQHDGGSSPGEFDSSDESIDRDFDQEEMPQDDMEVSAERGRNGTDDEDDEQEE